jgi:toxin-antitoxin system PIN domain toxin
MSSTLDANLLLFASDRKSAHHAPAVAFVERIAAGPEIVYLFWPTVMGYLRAVTHSGVFLNPLTLDQALANVEGLLDRPHVRSPGEGERFRARFREVAADAEPVGNLLSHAHVVALMLEHGVGTIWTRDRDYRRFRGIEVRDPFA